MAGPSLRMTIARLPRCIVLPRHGLAQENLQASAAKQGYVGAVGVRGFTNQGFLFTPWMAPKARSDCHLDL